MVLTIETLKDLLTAVTFFNAEAWQNTIVVHSGVFHAHDVVASLPFEIVIRTRSKEVINHCFNNGATVIDVGLGDLDHHSWKGYKGLETMFSKKQIESCEQADIVILESVARIDCGEEAIDYVSSTISSFNPCWNEPSSSDDYDAGFKAARKWAMTANASSIIAAKKRELAREAGKTEAAAIVDQAMLESAGSSLLVLHRFVPWQEKVVHYNELAHSGKTFSFLWVLFPSPDGSYRVQAVPKTADSVEFHAPVQAKPDDKGFVFCHPNKFICGYANKDDAIRAVRSW